VRIAQQTRRGNEFLRLVISHVLCVCFVALAGAISSGIFTAAALSINNPVMTTIRVLDLSHNARIAGPCPDVSVTYSDLETLDLSFTNVSGT
jgi:hypothetical protein